MKKSLLLLLPLLIVCSKAQIVLKSESQFSNWINSSSNLPINPSNPCPQIPMVYFSNSKIQYSYKDLNIPYSQAEYTYIKLTFVLFSLNLQYETENNLQIFINSKLVEGVSYAKLSESSLLTTCSASGLDYTTTIVSFIPISEIGGSINITIVPNINTNGFFGISSLVIQASTNKLLPAMSFFDFAGSYQDWSVSNGMKTKIVNCRNNASLQISNTPGEDAVKIYKYYQPVMYEGLAVRLLIQLNELDSYPTLNLFIDGTLLGSITPNDLKASSSDCPAHNKAINYTFVMPSTHGFKSTLLKINSTSSVSTFYLKQIRFFGVTTLPSVYSSLPINDLVDTFTGFKRWNDGLSPNQLTINQQNYVIIPDGSSIAKTYYLSNIDGGILIQAGLICARKQDTCQIDLYLNGGFITSFSSFVDVGDSKYAMDVKYFITATVGNIALTIKFTDGDLTSSGAQGVSNLILTSVRADYLSYNQNVVTASADTSFLLEIIIPSSIALAIILIILIIYIRKLCKRKSGRNEQSMDQEGSRRDDMESKQENHLDSQLHNLQTYYENGVANQTINNTLGEMVKNSGDAEYGAHIQRQGSHSSNGVVMTYQVDQTDVTQVGVQIN